MSRILVILFSALAIAIPAQTFALVTCHDRIDGCTLAELIQLNTNAADPDLTESERAQALKDVMLGLTQLLSRLQIDKSSAPVALVCLRLHNDLYIGKDDSTTDGEVSVLQKFLIQANVYPEAQVTGYYGPLTAQAVMRWQKANGMDYVTEKSGVGHATREKLQGRCADHKQVVKGTYNTNTLTAIDIFDLAEDIEVLGDDGVIMLADRDSVRESLGVSEAYRSGAISGGDTCVASTEAIIEILNPKTEQNALNSGRSAIVAELVRVISKKEPVERCVSLTE